MLSKRKKSIKALTHTHTKIAMDEKKKQDKKDIGDKNQT